MDTAGLKIGSIKSGGYVPLPNSPAGSVISPLVLALIGNIKYIAVKGEAAGLAARNVHNSGLPHRYCIRRVPGRTAGCRAA